MSIGKGVIALAAAMLLAFAPSVQTQPASQSASAIVAGAPLTQPSISVATATAQPAYPSSYSTSNPTKDEPTSSSAPRGSYITQDQLTAQLEQASNALRSLIYGQTGAPSSTPASGGLFNIAALAQRIDQLANTRLSNVTVSGISGLTAADIPTDLVASNYFALSGASVTGTSTFATAVAIGTTTTQLPLSVLGDAGFFNPLEGGSNQSAFRLRMRQSLTAFPVPNFSPVASNQVLAFDLIPNGSPSDFGNNGITWMDACDADLNADATIPVTCARVGVRSDRVEFGARSFNGGVLRPVTFTIGQTPVLEVMRYTPTGEVAIGATSPNARLTVHAGANSTSTMTTLFSISSSTTSTNSATLFSVQNTGNVGLAGTLGVGTFAPAHTLDVVGDCISLNGVCINTTAPSNIVTYAAGTYVFSSNTTVNINFTRFLGGANTAPATADVAGYVVAKSGTITNLYVAADGNTFTSATAALTLMKNGIATALTCTLAAAGLTCNDTSNSVSVTAGDTVSLRIVTTNSGTGTLTRPRASMTFNTTTSVFSSQWVTSGSDIYFTGGRVGVATSSPWRTLSVTGTVGFEGLTGSIGAGSLCLSANKEVVYNSGSDNCLSSTRATKHDIVPLAALGLNIVGALQPVSFVYNDDASSTVRFGFIAEDTAAIDPHLATYNEHGAISGIDDRSIIAIVVSALHDIAQITGGFKHALVGWLGDASNGIGDLFANRVIGNQLCAKRSDGTLVCLTGDQLASVFRGSASQDGVTDTTSPSIVLLGADPATLHVGDTYSDPGVTITDAGSPNIGYSVSVDGGSTSTPDRFTPDASTPGTHLILFSATDQAGDTGTATRTVIVEN